MRPHVPAPRLDSSLTPVYTEVDDDPRQVEYIEMKVKTALHHTRLPYRPKPSYYTLNLYRGCRHGCPFCFARYTHWFLGFQNTFDFQRKIQVKVNLLEVLEGELSNSRKHKDWVSLGAATDPYQPAEKKYGLARGAFTLLAKYRWPAVFSTKSDLVLRDLDVLESLRDRAQVGVAMTLTTLDPALKKFLEPHAAPIERRVETLRALKAHRIPCGIHLMPIIPFVTDSDEAIGSIVRLGAEVGVDYFIYNVLQLKGAVVRDYYFARLRQWNPEAWEKTRRLYGSRSYPNEAYLQALRGKVDSFRAVYGVQGRWRRIFGEKQGELFEK
ncbi:MAG TPA: radical SAM protein [bacterium]|nr:radical SAM protein [bacterium]